MTVFKHVVIALIILLSVFTNMYADYLLSGYSRKGVSKELPMMERYLCIARKNSRSNLYKASIIGCISISVWMFLDYFLLMLDQTWLVVVYSMYIGFVMVGHVVCCDVFLLAKDKTAHVKELFKYMKFISIVSIVFALIYSLMVVQLGMSEVLSMQWYHYATLPICTIVVIQFLLGSVVPNDAFQSFAGTIGQGISMLMMIHLIIQSGL